MIPTRSLRHLWSSRDPPAPQGVAATMGVMVAILNEPCGTECILGVSPGTGTAYASENSGATGWPSGRSARAARPDFGVRCVYRGDRAPDSFPRSRQLGAS